MGDLNDFLQPQATVQDLVILSEIYYTQAFIIPFDLNNVSSGLEPVVGANFDETSVTFIKVPCTWPAIADGFNNADDGVKFTPVN